MELTFQVHDIIQLNQVDDILAKIDNLPDWVYKSLQNTPYVVVRRGLQSQDAIPVGVRGESRNQRYALEISQGYCKKIITPQTLVNFIEQSNAIDLALKESLICLKEIFKQKGITWGIGGSIGFSLASNKKVYNTNSDIDILFYPQTMLSRTDAKLLLESIEQKINSSVDIQVLLSSASFNLREYVLYDEVLLKTSTGVKIINTNKLWEDLA